MATHTATTSGAWSAAGTWDANGVPADNGIVVINAGVNVLMDTDTSAFTGFQTVTITGGATPGMLYFANGTSGWLKIRTGYNLVGTTSTNRGRLLANSDGNWATSTALAFANKAVIDLQGTAKIDARNLDIKLYCAEPTKKYVRTYGTKYDFTASGSTVNTTNDTIDLGTTPPTAGTSVMITTASGTLPTGLLENTIYYIRGISGNTCKLSLQNADAQIVDITGTGSGTCTVFTGHTSTSTGTMNVLDDVTADTPWVTTANHNKCILSGLGPQNYDQQRLTLTTINAGSIVLSANVDSTQYPGAWIVLGSRNVSIRSAGTTAAQSIIDYAEASVSGAILGCEICNTAGTGTTFYGYGISSTSANNASNHAISGTVWGCSLASSYGSGYTISGTVSGCGVGISYGSGHTISGTVSGCGTGISYGSGHAISGTVCGCTNGFQYGTGHTISGTVSSCYYAFISINGLITISGIIQACSSALQSCTNVTISGTVSGCGTAVNSCNGVTISGTLSGCGTGISTGAGHIISGTLSRCATGCTLCSTLTITGTITICATGINNSSANLANATISNCTTGINYSFWDAYNINTFAGNTTDVSYSGANGGILILGRSFKHGGTSNDTRAWSAGGTITHETTEKYTGKDFSHKLTFVDSGYWTYMEWDLSRVESLSLSIPVYAKNGGTSLSADARVHWQIIDPTADPLISNGSALAEWIASDNNDWQSSTLTYNRNNDMPLKLRVCAKRAAGTNAYAYFDAMSASAGGLMRTPNMTGGF